MKTSSEIVQICFIVDDLDAAIDNWIETRNAGPFFVAKDLSGVPIDYKGTDSTLAISVAMGMAGDLQIELVEPIGNGPSVYSDMFAPGQTGFHHVATFVSDFEQAVRDHVSNGFEMNARGTFAGDKFAYMDTRSSVGFFTELYEEGPGLRGMYRKIAEAARDWDGHIRTFPLEDALT